MLFDLPVEVGVELKRNIGRRRARAKSSGLWKMEPIAHHSPAQGIRWRQVNPCLVRDVIGVGKEVFAGDLALPPLAPVVETQIQRVEGLVLRCVGIISLEESV